MSYFRDEKESEFFLRECTFRGSTVPARFHYGVELWWYYTWWCELRNQIRALIIIQLIHSFGLCA